jgi:signal transduction histidine kinase
LQHGFELTLDFAAVDLVPLIELLLEESRIAHPSLLIDTRLPASLHAEVDAVRFAQVIANLLSNARHHGQGEVSLRAEIDSAKVMLEISNPSPPIPAEIAGSLFDPFKRPSAANLRNRSGMGLGLYIAHQVVQGHNGQLIYRAADGRVIFEVHLPLRRVTA